MRVTVTRFLLLAAAIYLGLLSLTENDPVKAGLFLFGAIVTLVLARAGQVAAPNGRASPAHA